MNSRTSYQSGVVDLEDLKLSDVMQKINPYFFKSTLKLTGGEIVEHLVYAHVLSKKEYLKKNNEFFEKYSRMINILTIQFIKEFCKEDMSINWKKISKLKLVKK